ncbi:MAG: ATP-binding protein, partial [Syntrophales bacterium]|nr:ATP-binding protein [Syntrophales bacterium]
LGRGDYEYSLPFYGERRPILVDLAFEVDPELEKTYTTIKRMGNILFGESYAPYLPRGNVHLSATASLLHDLEGNLVGTIECIRDNTDRKQAEEALRESEKRLSDIIDFLPDATMVIDQKGTIIAWNKAIVNLTGVPAGDMLGKSDHEYALPFYRERRPMLIDIALHPELEGHTDHTRIYRHGDVLFAEALTPALPERGVYLTATASALRDTEGNVIGAIESFRNETERKNLESRLQQSEKMTSLSRISAGVAHEILNPVGIISLELQTLKRMGTIPREAREELDVCMEQIRRIVAIADNLKQFARATKDAMALENVNDVIARVMQMYASQMKIEGVVTDVRYDASIPPVVLDRGKIEQVLINLLSNAMVAMEGKDEKFLAIRSQRVDTEEGSHARIVVADRGTGILEKELQRIFEPFYTTRDQGKGTGMGLSIAHGIISQHGGRIWAENNEWGGASFFIELPVQEEMQQQEK